ncbi:hypothetical protein [Marinobacterium aestuariivivens]|uniref:Uncharacterized protein n=1 Tax=Marinobacterium aestuariivivens TaxID=1698799 RepID=A0ABW2A7N7_9GAMM
MAVTLVLFCKKPGPGIGKQRLARALGADTAWRIAELLHRCALEQLRSWPGPKVLATADRADLDGYRNAFPWIDRLLVQPPGNLGLRINRIDRMLRAGVAGGRSS